MAAFRLADPQAQAERAAARREAAEAEIQRARLVAQLGRERREAADQERRRRAEVARQDRAERRDRRRQARAHAAARLRPVAPLLLINGGAAYAQAAYAFEQIAPPGWNTASKVAFAVAFSAALESIAVYVQWHAHDALMLKAYGTAASLRRASWLIAAVVAGINYAHFAHGLAPTSAAVAFALLSLLSPWLWGLHTRRAQHMQLLAEDPTVIDDAGVEFSPRRRHLFPIRTFMATRWAIEHGERDPRRAWEGYNAERAERRATMSAERAERRATMSAERAARRAAKPSGKPAAAEPVREPSGEPVDGPTAEPIGEPVAEPPPRPRVSARSLSAGERVKAAHGRHPQATNARIAELAGVSLATVKRHRPAGSPTALRPAETLDPAEPDQRVNGAALTLVGQA